MNKDIAIIGIAGRFPEAANIEELCSNLRNARDSVREISDDRIKLSTLPVDGTYMKLGYIEDIDKFDYNLFCISPAEAQTMDPIQRLLLEVTYETIENAGYNVDFFKGIKASVFVGDISSEYYTHADSYVPTLVTGNSKIFHAARIARQFDFTGNAVMVDSACSSSLVAVVLACNELILGQAEYALVAGVNLYLFPYKTEGNDLDIWSPDGVPRAFSAQANGMSRGEVVASILLKPLEKAIQDKDIIHAVIKGYSVNNNASKSSSPSAPDSVSQADVIKDAWEKAGINPLDIGYIEAHGSGTQLGDSLEIEGLNIVFNTFTNKKHICPISTIKNNIGHGMAAAGLTGLIKSILTIKKGLLFPTIHFDEPNPIIDFINSAVYVNERLCELEKSKKYAAVTSLGASGVNCHLVLEKAPETTGGADNTESQYVFTVSSRTPSGLKRNIKVLYDRLIQDDTSSLEDISYTLNHGRKHYNCRWSIIAGDMEELKLQLFSAADYVDLKELEPRKLNKAILIFSDYDGIPENIVKTLLSHHPLFKTYYDECMNLCTYDSSSSKVFAFQYCLYKVLTHYGVTAPNILGVGLGSIVNSVISGQVSLEEGIKKALDYRKSDIKDIDARAAALVDRETADGPAAFVEMGTGSILTASLNAVKGINDRFYTISIPEFPEYDPVLELLKGLYNSGANIDWNSYYRNHAGRKTELPSYQFEKTRCWLREEPRKTPELSNNGSMEPGRQTFISALKEDGTSLQQTIAGIWCEVLKLDSISLEDDFFDVGGDSLKAATVINRLNRDLGINLSFEDIFDFSILKLLDGYIDGQMTTEKKLCGIWKEVLKLDEIKPEDNFFSLGGHSLMANQVLLRVNKEFGIDLNFENIFEYQTVSALAGYIDGLILECTPGSKYKRIEQAEQREYYDVSPQQKRAWILSQFKEGSVAYNTSGAYLIEGKLDHAAFDRAFDSLVERHESLRTVFIEVKGEPKQKIIPPGGLKLSIQRIELGFEEEKENRLKQIIKQQEVKQFDLSNGPLLSVTLIRTEENVHIFLFIIHHIISDGWSIDVLFNDILALYNAYSQMKDNPLKPLRIQYKDYTEWEAEEQKSEQFKKHRSYWMEKLGGTLPVLELPSDVLRPAIQSFNGDKVLLKINKELTKSLNELCRKHDCTLFMGLVTVINVLFYRYTGQRDIILGFPIAGRKHADLEEQIGYYVNTLPLRTQFEHDDTFEKLLCSVKRTTLEAYEHQQYHFDRLVSELNPKRDLSRNAIFDVMVVLQNIGRKNDEDVTANGLRVKKYEIEQYTSKMDMLFEFIEEGDEISVSIEFNSDIYFKNCMERMACHLVNLIRYFTGQSQAAISEADYICADEVEFINKFNATGTDYPKDICIHQVFEKVAGECPEKMALIVNDTKLTYGELNVRSSRLATYLRKQGAGRDCIIGICMKRSVEMIVAIFAILKAGGAYMPISIDLPDERIRFMLEDSGAKLVLVNGDSFAERACPPARHVDVSQFDLYGTEDEYAGNVNMPHDLAYVIYTSGTTGNPKGVMIEHHSVINRLSWMQKMYPLSQQDVILQKTSYSFDVSVWELFWWSFAGAVLCILNQGEEKQPEAIIRAIERNKVTTIHFVPSMLEVFLEYLGNMGGLEKLSCLKQVFASGEALLPQHVIKFNQLIKSKHDTRLINLYGPTEATVDVSYYNCPSGLQIDKVFIGKPIDNIRLYVVDKNYKLQPLGIPGELCIAGVGLARGYLNRPELDREKFVTNPFESDGVETYNGSQKGKMYRTGDIARLLPDGNIEFLGRIDHQVKIRGYRIELGEIENCIMNIGNIKKCVVTDVEMGRNKYLCAYIVPGENVLFLNIKNILMEKLPDYMVPAFFVQLENIPLNSNGKVDRGQLPYPQINTEEKITLPVNATETKLVKIWSEVLGIKEESIGRNSNFFDIGGNSLNLITLGNKITGTFSKSIAVEDLFRYPSVSSLAQFISLGEAGRELTNEEIDESVDLMEKMAGYLEDGIDE